MESRDNMQSPCEVTSDCTLVKDGEDFNDGTKFRDIPYVKLGGFQTWIVGSGCDIMLKAGLARCLEGPTYPDWCYDIWGNGVAESASKPWVYWRYHKSSRDMTFFSYKGDMEWWTANGGQVRQGEFN